MKAHSLLNKNFILLFQGQLVSVMGSSAYSLAFVFWLKQTTGSASLMGLLTMTALIPAVLLGPFGGTLVDHYSRKKILVLCDVINGIFTCCTALVMIYLPSRIELIIAMMFMGAIINGICMSLFRPAIMALIPDLVPSKRLMMANGLMQNAHTITMLIGQTLGGVLFRVLGAPLLMLLDGMSYLVSALSESFITLPKKTVNPKLPWKDTLHKFKVDTLHGFHFVMGNPGLKALLFFSMVNSFFMAPMPVLLPFFVEDTLGASVDWFGYMMAGSALGVILGGLLIGMLPIKTNHRSWIVLISFAVTAIAFVGFGYCKTPLASVLVQLLIGIMMGSAGILITSAMQLGTPSNMHGRVFGLMGPLGAILAPVSLGFSGLAVDALDKNIPLIFILLGVGMFLCVLGVTFSKGFHQLMAADGENEPILDS